jgi:hypothetical protein
MSRVASVLLLAGGVVLCVTWLVSPASSAPQLQGVPPTSPPPSVDDATVEAIRLPVAPSAPITYPPPRRDPFAFQPRVDAAPRTPLPPPVAPPVRAPVRLPRLVAIVKDATASGDVYRAVLSADGASVTIVTLGTTFGGFTITEIRADVVVLRDADSGDLFRLSIR